MASEPVAGRFPRGVVGSSTVTRPAIPIMPLAVAPRPDPGQAPMQEAPVPLGTVVSEPLPQGPR